MNRLYLRRLCLVAAIGCFATLLIPRVNRTNTPETQRTEISMGLPFSPWLRFEDERTLTQQKINGTATTNMSFKSSSKIEFISWSALAVISGIGLLAVARHLAKRDRAATVVQSGDAT